MPLLRQLEFAFQTFIGQVFRLPNRETVEAQALGLPNSRAAIEAVALQFRGRDAELEQIARKLLRLLGAARLAHELRVEWNSRLKTTAGRADYRERLIYLNPQLTEHPAEVERTLRHELAHILAQFRAGRRRILPHGSEWRQACQDLAISDEKRCHNLPFPVSERARRYLYRCPNCQRDFLRVRRIKRAVACLACCRVHNGGKFDARFRLRPVTAPL
jgi:predicted SprT family Zn-dependent metalloprotease